MNDSRYVSIGTAATLLGVCTKTLRRWEKSHKFLPAFRTVGNHRRYDRAKVVKYLQNNNNLSDSFDHLILNHNLRAAIYARVSSSRQKTSGELLTQVNTLKIHCMKQGYTLYKTYTDVGSGLNDNRQGLLTMLRDASDKKFEIVLVNYNDRLARFGLQIIREYLRSWNVRLFVLNPVIIKDSDHGELVTDLTSILYSFMGKLYRSRRKKKLKKNPLQTIEISPS